MFDKLDDIIGRSEEYDKLDVIFSGPVPPNPAELLLSERFDRLITELRKRYDYIIVDNVNGFMRLRFLPNEKNKAPG